MRRVLLTFVERCALSLALLAACGPKPPARTALSGNLAELKRDIQSAQQAGKLDRDAVVDLAQAVGERELTSAEGANGASRVRSLRGCARPLRSAMERRARADDDIAAELTLILLETHAATPAPLLQRYARSPSAAWRAVAARAAQRPIDTDMRKAFIVDPDQQVRRAAFATALDVHDAGELEALLEAARVDPDPQSRSLALRAVGAIGGERAVLALKDLWVRADDATRIAIVDAWTAQPSFVSGGARELAWAAERGGGLAAVSASYALARAGGAESVVANARLRRDISDGSDDAKRLALRVAPMEPETEAAIAKAAKEASPELRVVALARLSQIAARRSDALRQLRELANAKASSESELRAQGDALSALADAGDPSVLPKLIKDVRDPELARRSRAARGLTSLGDYGNAASALADDDANLRSEVACLILARESAHP
ncbi:MAG TPA: HEAT repeat domain-containing protein [Polyangiaceae bacterium]|nr:HEAT repeat domain-containing protein [Polyangiaceae bacterium]